MTSLPGGGLSPLGRVCSEYYPPPHVAVYVGCLYDSQAVVKAVVKTVTEHFFFKTICTCRTNVCTSHADVQKTLHVRSSTTSARYDFRSPFRNRGARGVAQTQKQGLEG